MGILDKWRKKTKEQIADEENKIINKKYTANDELTKKQLKDIKQQAGRNVIRRKLIKMGVATVSCAALGITMFNLVDDFKKELKSESDNRVEEPITNPTPVVEKDDIEEIESAKDAAQYFKKLYVEEYNKDHNTDIKEEDITFYSENQAWMYDVGGKCVSRGSYPEGVELKLERQNIDYKKREDLNKMYSIIIKDENGESKILESITIDGENILPVVPGKDYLDGKQLNSDEVNTLSKQGKLIEYSVDLVMAYKNGHSNDSYEVYLRKKSLSGEVEKNKQRRMDEQIQADIEMGVR